MLHPDGRHPGWPKTRRLGTGAACRARPKSPVVPGRGGRKRDAQPRDRGTAAVFRRGWSLVEWTTLGRCCATRGGRAADRRGAGRGWGMTVLFRQPVGRFSIVVVIAVAVLAWSLAG